MTTPTDSAQLFQHVVLMRFPEPLVAAEEAELFAMVASWPELIGTMSESRIGADITGARSQGFQYLLHTVFPDADVFNAYVAHPVHQQLVAFIDARNCERLAFDYYF